MKQIQLVQPGHFQLNEVADLSAPEANSALVRVHRIGVCGTDIHAFQGHQPFFTYPRVLGHELGVEVMALGSGDHALSVGDRCAVEPYMNCGHCIACRHGKGNCCTEMRVLGVHIDGGHCEYLQIPSHKLHRSEHLTYDQLALVEPLGIGAHAVERAQLSPGETVLVIGAGPIGLAVIQFALAAGARVLVMDINAERLDFCRRHLGIEDCILANAGGILELLMALTDGDLPTAVFDATGNARSMMAAFDYPAHGGRLIFVGLFQGDVSFHDPQFHKRELTLLASRNARSEDFTKIIQLIEKGKIDTRAWITHRASFTDFPSAFPEWILPQTQVLKAMIEC